MRFKSDVEEGARVTFGDTDLLTIRIIRASVIADLAPSIRKFKDNRSFLAARVVLRETDREEEDDRIDPVYACVSTRGQLFSSYSFCFPLLSVYPTTLSLLATPPAGYLLHLRSSAVTFTHARTYRRITLD